MELLGHRRNERTCWIVGFGYFVVMIDTKSDKTSTLKFKHNYQHKHNYQQQYMNQSTDWVSYFNEKLSISLILPKDWQIGSNEDFELILLAPAEDNYRPNVGFSKHGFKNPTRPQFEAAIKKTKENQRKDHPDYKLLAEEPCWIDSSPAYHQNYEWKSKELGRSFVQTLTLILTQEDGLYEINGTTLKGKEGDYLPIFEKIIESIRFIEIGSQK